MYYPVEVAGGLLSKYKLVAFALTFLLRLTSPICVSVASIVINRYG